jgi:hypothetical protein
MIISYFTCSNPRLSESASLDSQAESSTLNLVLRSSLSRAHQGKVYPRIWWGDAVSNKLPLSPSIYNITRRDDQH